MDQTEYRKLVEQRRSWYKTIKKVYCPCLRMDVIFNSRGFYHVRRDSYGKERPLAERIMRLNLLPLVIPAIRQAKKVKEHRLSGATEYWALEEIVGKQRVKIRVVLTRRNAENVIYFSVMKVRKQKDRHSKR